MKLEKAELLHRMSELSFRLEHQDAQLREMTRAFSDLGMSCNRLSLIVFFFYNYNNFMKSILKLTSLSKEILLDDENLDELLRHEFAQIPVANESNGLKNRPKRTVKLYLKPKIKEIRMNQNEN